MIHAGVNYQRAMAAYVAAAQNYNDMVMKISSDWANYYKLQVRIAARGRQAVFARLVS